MYYRTVAEHYHIFIVYFYIGMQELHAEFTNCCFQSTGLCAFARSTYAVGWEANFVPARILKRLYILFES